MSPTSRLGLSSRFLRHPLALGAVLLPLGLAILLVTERERSPELREFRGSYPAARWSTGVAREFRLTAAPAEVEVAGRPLEVWAYNGRIPGPTLRVRLGETLRVQFTNRLPQATTIHWHGVRVPNAMDGVPWVTQPPVQPGESFVYEFAPKDAGTFWFHPHLRSSEQVERGLFGVLIVDDPAPLPYSRDELWVLDDWLLTGDGRIDPRFNTRRDLAHDGRWGNVVTVNGAMRPTLAVQPGERIRLRLLNVANGRVFAPDLSAFDAKVIAVDGMFAAEPLDPAGFELAPGNRLDVDLVIPKHWQGRHEPVVDRFTRRPIVLGTVAVDGPAVETPLFDAPATAHVPDWKGLDAIAPRAEFRLNARQGGRFGIQWTINEQAFEHRHDQEIRDLTLVPIDTFSKLRFVNESFRLHPMHIHGVFFKVLARNGVPVDEAHWRDTVLLRRKETVDVGLVPLDEGRWMLHCHILEHAESGMMTLIDVR